MKTRRPFFHNRTGLSAYYDVQASAWIISDYQVQFATKREARAFIRSKPNWRYVETAISAQEILRSIKALADIKDELSGAGLTEPKLGGVRKIHSLTDQATTLLRSVLSRPSFREHIEEAMATV